MDKVFKSCDSKKLSPKDDLLAVLITKDVSSRRGVVYDILTPVD